MQAILSIKPIYADRIFSGEKKFEYRKQIFKYEVTDIILYATSPICMIVGEFKVVGIIYDTPKAIWEKTCQSSGVSREFFFAYYGRRSMGIAIKVGTPKRYRIPINPYNDPLYGKSFFPPQSFRYVNSKSACEGLL